MGLAELFLLHQSTTTSFGLSHVELEVTVVTPVYRDPLQGPPPLLVVIQDAADNGAKVPRGRPAGGVHSS